MGMALKDGRRIRSKGGDGFRGLKSRGGERRLRGKGVLSGDHVPCMPGCEKGIGPVFGPVFGLVSLFFNLQLFSIAEIVTGPSNPNWLESSRAISNTLLVFFHIFRNYFPFI